MNVEQIDCVLCERRSHPVKLTCAISIGRSAFFSLPSLLPPCEIFLARRTVGFRLQRQNKHTLATVSCLFLNLRSFLVLLRGIIFSSCHSHLRFFSRFLSLYSHFDGKIENFLLHMFTASYRAPKKMCAGMYTHIPLPLKLHAMVEKI